MSDVTAAAIGQIGKAFETVVADSKTWTRIQKVGGFAVCVLTGVALISGAGYWGVPAAAAIILYGIALLDPVKANLLQRTVEAEMIVLKDRSGTPKIVLHPDYGIMLLDERQDTFVVARILDGTPAIAVSGGGESVMSEVANGKAIVSVGEAAGRHVGRGSRLTAETVAVGPPDGSGVMLATKGDEALVSLSEPGDLKHAGVQLLARRGAALLAIGRRDKPNWSLSASDEAGLGLTLVNAKGGLAANLTADPDGLSPGLTVYDRNGKPVAMFPDAENLG